MYTNKQFYSKVLLMTIKMAVLFQAQTILYNSSITTQLPPCIAHALDQELDQKIKRITHHLVFQNTLQAICTCAHVLSLEQMHESLVSWVVAQEMQAVPLFIFFFV